MSELDLLLNRKKSPTPTPNSAEKREESEVETVQREENRVEARKVNEEPAEKKEEGKEKSKDSTVEEIMASFLDRDPKIGVWSYPAFLVLQYLYNTKPGFKMSRVAKEALEMGLRQMYPELFAKAEKVYKERMKK